jgi:hypothetical protein
MKLPSIAEVQRTNVMPKRGQRIEVLVNGEWYAAEHAGPARGSSEFWARTDAGGVIPVRYGYEGTKWRWPQDAPATQTCRHFNSQGDTQ